MVDCVAIAILYLKSRFERKIVSARDKATGKFTITSSSRVAQLSYNRINRRPRLLKGFGIWRLRFAMSV